MTITLKEFGQFVLDFVNKNFVPLLQLGSPQHQKSLQHWRQAANIIRDIQKTNYWNLEVCLKNIDGGTLHLDSKDSKQFKKNQNSRANIINYSTYDNLFDKKDSIQGAYSLQDQVRVNSSYKGSSKEQSEPRNKSFKYTASHDDFQNKMSFDSKVSKEKAQSLSDPDGFEKLIQSFKKLCVNFENNHKKLLKQDQNFKQNYKEQLSQH